MIRRPQRLAGLIRHLARQRPAVRPAFAVLTGLAILLLPL